MQKDNRYYNLSLSELQYLISAFFDKFATSENEEETSVSSSKSSETTDSAEEAASWGYISTGEAIFRDEGLYLSYGVYAGTGIFFSDGGVSLINYDDGSQTLVYADSDLEKNWDSTKTNRFRAVPFILL
ncbi:MAG: hypothetical protein LUH36_02550 [Oscillospiraceae bacterium]|nr:hypothetical protein [Oscillospiraceae bacterium]